MNIRRVKQGAKISYYNGIYMIFLGLYFIFFIKFNMKQNFNAINELWGFFLRYNSKIAGIFNLFNILIGISLISHGIIIIYLSDFLIKRKEKITWVVLLISELTTWAALLVISILLKNLYLIVLSSIGWLMFVIGMIIPVRYYLEKSYKEY